MPHDARAVTALRRIAFLLELAQEPTYRVRAFRRAADLVSALTADEVERRIRDGSLQQLPGIGAVTALAIAEAHRGEAPVYLRRLESTEGRAVADDAAALRGALRGDCHTHSDWSDGGSSILEMAEAARLLGHEYVALTDHSPRLTVARGLSAARLRQQLEEVERLNVGLAPFRILTGIEVDINEDGSLDQENGLLDRVASSSAEGGRSRSSTRRTCSLLASGSTSPWRSTHVPSGSTRLSGCSGWHWRQVAASNGPQLAALRPILSSTR